MYKILGADGREYGPVSADQIRQWITEGRVNSQTLVQAAGQTDWKRLVNFPELQPPAVPPPLSPPFPLAVRPRPMGAEKKLPAGICGILLGGLGIHKFILGYTSEGVTMLAVTLCSIPVGILTCGIGFLGISAMHIIGLVEGIIYLTKSDEEFVATYVTGKKGWF